MIDPRLPNVEIMSDRYFDVRPKEAVVPTNAWRAVNNTIDFAWVCPCRIAGVVYNRSASKCGYCGKDNKYSERTAEWGFTEENPNAWALERLDPSEVQPFSDKHKLSLPRKATDRVGGRAIQKSGILFVILRAMGFNHATSYRTAAQPVAWDGEKSKIRKVIELLISSGELADLKAETKKIYKV